ncbi:hypothetical protein CesoFtcFv8_023520 [Champsocephalus esox]|uniref:Uncharacterized protein n=1 Tax=Champsocephalus esox TaxID=159716 RepID=A0AAN8B8F7_9TELE|nr:hypothetical protein CesoFtcFv8_023520 [Champsocephalus esox]
MTDAKGTLARGVGGAVMSSACQHLHLPTFLPLTARALDVTQRCNTSCSSHLISQSECAGYFRVTAFCFIWVFVMDISSPPCSPPFHTFLEELCPLLLWSTAVTLGVELSKRALSAYHTAYKATTRTCELQRSLSPNHQQHIEDPLLVVSRAGSHITTTEVFPNDSGF